jgi:[ribosomal protein S5]-alanine N-acetyltransferase
MLENIDLNLQTERLILREFREEDWEAMHEYGSDPETVRYMPWGPNKEQMTRDFLKTVLDNQKARPRLSYNSAVVCKADGKLIGSCRLRISDYKEGELGYILNRRYWNEGYMSEAAGRVIAFGFAQLGLHRIFANCHPANTGSYRVMEKTGMQKEGYLREYKRFKGIWFDNLQYSILDHEWRSRQEHSDSRKPEHIREISDTSRNIEYVARNQEALDLIQPLWQKLTEHHEGLSRYFKDHYARFTFTLRKEQLLKKSREGALRVDLARDTSSGTFIGYCVTSLNREKQGEIESIYVEKDYRGCGVGAKLMNRALSWLEAEGAIKIILDVADGNESVFGFYRRFGFYPRLTVLERKTDLK